MVIAGAGESGPVVTLGMTMWHINLWGTDPSMIVANACGQIPNRCCVPMQSIKRWCLT